MGNVIRLPPPNDHGAPYPRHGNTVNQNQKKQDSTTLLSIRYNHGRLPVIPGVGSYGTTWFQQTSKEHTSIASTSSLALGPCATHGASTLLLGRRGLRLECLSATLSGLVGSLARLHFLRGRLTLCAADLRLLRTLLLNLLQRSTHDRAVELCCFARPTAGNLFHLDLLIKAPPCLRPSELRGLLPLVQQALALGREQRDGLPIPTDEADAVSRINTRVRKRADLSLDHHGAVVSCAVGGQAPRL